MADEVVGEVRIDVHGNTEPLKDDIKRAARDIQKTVDTEVSGSGSTSITDNIVSQVADAEKPAGTEAKKVGRAIAKGVEIGTKDVDTKGRITADLERAEAPLRDKAERLGRSLGEATGKGMVDARREATSKTSETVRVNVETSRSRPITDLAATESEWKEFGLSMNRSLEIAFMPWMDARKAMRDDAIKAKIEVDREAFSKELKDSEKEWFDFGGSLGAAMDTALRPWWRHLGASMKSAFSDDTGSTQIGLKAGRNIGEAFSKGVGGGDKSTASKAMAGLKKNLLGALAAGGLQAAMYGVGARVAAVLGGGLLSQLATVGEGVVGWASSIVGQVGQALIGVGAVVAGTIGTAFAGLGATAYSSIAAVMPAIVGLKLAFSGMEKEEKKAFDERLKKATENLNGFGRALREELLDPMFAAIKTFDKLVPTLNKFGATLGKTAAGLITEFAEVFTSGPMIKQINTFLQASAGYLDQIGTAGIDLAKQIIPAFNAISPVTKKFFTDISKGLGVLSDTLAKLSKGGTNSILTTTLDEWYERGKRLLGVFGTFAGSIAQVLNVGAQVRGDTFLTSLEKTADKFEDFINRIAANDVLSDKLSLWYDRGADLVSAFGNLSKIVVGFFDEAADAAGNASGRFDATTEGWLDAFTAFRQSGDLGNTLKDWFDQGETLLGILGNLGQSLVGIFKQASGASGDFLTDFETVTQKWEDWIESIEGQITLKEYFEGAKEVLDEVWGLLGDIGGLFEETFTGDTTGLVDFVKMLREDVIPAIDDFMDGLRNSGIQDALFDFAEAVGKLFGSIDESSVQVLLTTLAGIVDTVADLLDVLSPILGPLAVFLGYFKALTIAKSAFTGLLALPEMIGNLIGPADDAKDAIGGLGDSMGDAGDGLETGADGLSNKVDVAIGILAAFGVLASSTAQEFDESSAHIDAWAKDAEAGVLGIQAAGEMDRSFWEKWGPLRIIEGFTNGGGGGWGARDAGEEIGADLGGGFISGMKRFTAGVGFDWAGIGKSKEAVVAQFAAIEQAMMKTGDVDAAREAVAEFQQMLEGKNVDVKFYADALYDVNKAMDEVAKTQAALPKEVGLNFVGNFTDTKTALDSIGVAYDKNIKDKIDAIKNNPAYKNAATGGLNPEGMVAMTKLWKDANVDMINGVNDAIGKEATQTVRDILMRDSSWTEFGALTGKAQKALAKLLPGAIAAQAPILAEQARKAEAAAKAHMDRMDAILGRKPATRKDVAKAGLKEFFPKDFRAGIEEDFNETLFGARLRISARQIQLENPSALPEEIEALVQSQAYKILVGMETEEAVSDLQTLFGPESDWEIELGLAFPAGAQAKYIEVKGQLMQLTEEGEWEAVVDIKTINAIEASEDVYEVTVGPDGKPRVALIKVEDRGTTDAQNAIDAAARDRTAKITVWTRFNVDKNSKYDPLSGKYYTTTTVPKAERDMFIPPEEPSMISPGGPTTMGFMDSFTPFADQRANRVTGPGVVGSPNYWGGDDDPKAAKNITINNYYPEPERASDTVAMSLRLARYGG